MLQATDNPQATPTAELEALLESRFTQRTLVFNDGRQAIREVGQGPAIVLLHGIGSGAASWLQVALELSLSARVIAWDAPGYGNSTPLNTQIPRAESYAERLHKMLDALSIEQCVLVGHSLGAMTAVAFASGAQQHRVSKLVLISPARGYGAADRQILREQVRSKRLRSLEELGIEQIARSRSPHLLSPKATPKALAWVCWNMAQLNPQGYRQAVELLCGDDLLRHAPLSMPCQVHCGDADAITAPESCLTLAKALNASFNLIGNAGHASPIEQPIVVAGLLACAIKESQTGSAQ